MQQTGFLPVVKRWWLVIVLAGVVAGGTAYVVASRIPPTYEAQVALLTGPINTDYGTIRASGDLARTYAELATSGPLLDRTARRLRLGMTGKELRPQVTATSNDVTRLVRIRVKDGDAERAAAIANEIARRLAALTRRAPPESAELTERLLEDPQLAGLAPEVLARIEAAADRLLRPPSEGRLAVVEPAVAPDEPIAPRVSLITLLAILAGLVGAAIIVLLTELSSDRIDDEERLTELAEIPLLGSIGSPLRAPGTRERGLIVESAPTSSTARDYRVLATKIGLVDTDRPTRSLLVVGAEARAGSGAVAANLAALLAQKDERVALVDANDVQAEVTQLLGLNGAAGYSELIASNGDGGSVEAFGVRHDAGFLVLPRGEVGANVMLDVEHAQRALDRLLEENDRVVIAAPTVDASAATLVWAHVADATLLVVRRGRSRREAVTEAVRALRLAGARVSGAVLREGRSVVGSR